ncbi:MAG: hypothetical protein WC745_03075 [Patescibacteria group bacterium]|jgi:hypothetical protein
MANFKNYFSSFWKYYILRKPKLILTIVLTIAIYFWIANIISEIPAKYAEHEILARSYSGIYLIFLKPIFSYIAGLAIINKI